MGGKRAVLLENRSGRYARAHGFMRARARERESLHVRLRVRVVSGTQEREGEGQGSRVGSGRNGGGGGGGGGPATARVTGQRESGALHRLHRFTAFIPLLSRFTPLLHHLHRFTPLYTASVASRTGGRPGGTGAPRAARPQSRATRRLQGPAGRAGNSETRLVEMCRQRGRRAGCGGRGIERETRRRDAEAGGGRVKGRENAPSPRRAEGTRATPAVCSLLSLLL